VTEVSAVDNRNLIKNDMKILNAEEKDGERERMEKVQDTTNTQYAAKYENQATPPPVRYQ